MADKNSRLIWLDLEMTGLNPDTDRIIEIATVITDANLDVVDKGPEIAIFQPDSLLANMNDWCKKQHASSGLTKRVQNSNISENEAENLTIDFIKKHVKANQSPMCGNSICQDRRFLFRYMPNLEKYFHYRNLDVSSLKLLAQYWQPDLLTGVKKQMNHRAYNDIIDSINELKWYRTNMFKL